MRSYLAVAICCITAARPIPYVPLIERQEKLFVGALQPANHVANIYDFFNLSIHRQIHGQVMRAITARLLRISKVAMQGDAIHHTVTFLEHLPVPLEVSWHEGTARSAGNQL